MDDFSREKILGYGIVDHKFLRIVDVLPRHVFLWLAIFRRFIQREEYGNSLPMYPIRWTCFREKNWNWPYRGTVLEGGKLGVTMENFAIPSLSWNLLL